MSDDFIPFEMLLLPSRTVEATCESASRLEQPAMEALDACESPLRVAVLDALAAARRFHGALADALEFNLERLLRTIASEVLGRELALAAAEIRSIAAAALARYAADVPVRLRAHPHEIEVLAALNVAVVADPSLERGDFALEVRTGTIEATLAARAQWALERVSGV
jgi:flagellar biosynthesis/type III secretory pathway protein FliH